MGQLIIISAPSGSGKGTIIEHLLKLDLDLQFSISATSRPSRGQEQNGKEYYFLSPDEFRAKIANDEFLEYEEVYTDKYYGTLKAEVKRITDAGKNVIFDVDVLGGSQIKKFYGDGALSVFIKPPSIDALRERLVKRNTETLDVIETRIARAAYELSFEDKYDKVVVNDDLETAQKEVYQLIKEFVKK